MEINYRIIENPPLFILFLCKFMQTFGNMTVFCHIMKYFMQRLCAIPKLPQLYIVNLYNKNLTLRVFEGSLLTGDIRL